MVLVLVAENQHGESFENETPDHTEGIRFAQDEHVAAREHDRCDLQERDHVYDAMVGAVFLMRMTEPVEQHAVFGDAGEHSGGTDDCGIHGAGKNQEADEDDESAQRNPCPQRPDHEHRESADQIVAVVGHADAVGDDHDGEERHQRGQEQAVDENDEPGTEKVLQLGRRDFAVDLRERLLTRHREDRMPERDHYSDCADGPRAGQMLEPSERFVGELQFERRHVSAANRDREAAPYDHHHGHHGGDLHDAHRLAAGFLDAENILVPEINGYGDGEERGAEIRRKDNSDVRELEQLIDQADQILSCGDAADRAGQDVVEHERGDGNFRKRRAHRLFHDAIHAATREHRARLDVHGAHCVGEEHHREDEIRGRAAAGLLDDSTDVVGCRREIAKNDRGRSPEGNEGEHSGSNNYSFGLSSEGRLRLSPLGARDFWSSGQVRVLPEQDAEYGVARNSKCKMQTAIILHGSSILLEVGTCGSQRLGL